MRFVRVGDRDDDWVDVTSAVVGLWAEVAPAPVPVVPVVPVVVVAVILTCFEPGGDGWLAVVEVVVEVVFEVVLEVVEEVVVSTRGLDGLLSVLFPPNPLLSWEPPRMRAWDCEAADRAAGSADKVALTIMQGEF
jgi:hypothetical protein